MKCEICENHFPINVISMLCYESTHQIICQECLDKVKEEDESRKQDEIIHND